MIKILKNPIFIFGLLLRLFLIQSNNSINVSQWYVPFLDLTLTPIKLDPWSTWLESYGDLEAFPYGYSMWFSFIPIYSIFKIINIKTSFSYFITLLGFDLFLFWIIKLMIPNRDKLLLFSYWLSPIIIIPTYFLGLNDIIPALFLLLSIYHIRN